MRMIEEPAFITIPIETYRAILNEVQALRARVDALEAHQLDDTARLAREIALVSPETNQAGKGRTSATTTGQRRHS